MTASIDAGAVVSLARLPFVGAARLRALLRHHAPVEALAAVAGREPLDAMVWRGIPRSEMSAMRAAANRADPEAERARCDRLGVDVVWLGGPAFPAILEHDPHSPAALFVRGDIGVLGQRRVGVVGTRNATLSGLATARDLGEELAAAGVGVVSGLALGIDGAAHQGARRSNGPGRPIGVVGSGPDVVYPRRHADMWSWVATDGLLVSEWPPGTPPEAFRFPERNRILAALSEVLVVVESRRRGGSLITVREAADRGIEVMAVPGSPRCPASAGTNQLLRDGAAPVLSAVDVLMTLGLDHRRCGSAPVDPRPMPHGNEALVLAACELEPSTVDTLASTTGLSLAETALAAARLEHVGWLAEAGGWFETTASKLRPSA